jgi:error-prone DNA polymerase
LVLLAESRQGYAHLSTLITRARMDSPRGHPCVSLDTLARHADGLFALTGCPRGWVPALCAAGDHDGARTAAATLADIFGGRIAIECWDHGLAQERQLVPQLIGIARTIGVPWVVTNDVHYATPEGRIVQDVLSCLRHDQTLDTMGTRLRPNGEWYLKSAAQMRRRWRHDLAGIRATLAIAERCAFRLEQLRPSLPAFPLPPGISADEYLERLVMQGVEERWGEHRGMGEGRWGMREGNTEVDGRQTSRSRPAPNPMPSAPRPPSHIPHPATSHPRVRTEFHDRQIRHELDLIRRLGLAGYFLIVWDIVRFARREGILCQGRGSAANSAVCYCLGITAVDPIKLGLLFERFLSDDRHEAPDIDIDFAHRERERVIQYVYERYGREHAAMVCEQITYRGRSAVRDAARVLGFSVEQASALSAVSDRFSARATAERLRGSRAEGRGPTDEDDEDDDVGNACSDADEARRMAAARSGRPELARGRDASAALADTLGQRMVPGTEATTRTREVKSAARKVDRRGEMAAARERAPTTGKRMTSSDRPRPNAAYEPYGSPSAQSSGATFSFRDLGAPHPRTPDPGPRTPDFEPPTPSRSYLDPYAEDTHNERRNPTTALGPSAEEESVVVHAGLDPSDRRVQALAEIVEGLHDIPRHRSIHVGGFVLTAEPLSTVVPIEPASMPDRTVIQWEKDDLDPVGLVKIDLLGLGMLTLLQDCLAYIRATRGCTLNLWELDMTDQAVYDDLCRADTIGIFQVESRAQMNTLPRLKPRCFYDLVVEVAIIRPGPIQGDMVHPYLRRRAGEEPVEYPHPSLEPILKRTLGVPLFQEQGMQVAITAAGFTPGEADALRRAMGHKRSRERMAAICEQLIEGMKRNGIPEETGRRIYNQINAFADYGFPESHAASFALLVYASAYLKHYYAPEFTAAILNAQPMGFYAPGTLVEDARRHGVEVRPVNLMRSKWDATLEPGRESGKRKVERGEEAIRSNGNLHRDRGRDPSVLDPNASTPLSSFRFPLSAPPAVRLGLRSIRGLGPKAQEKLERALVESPFTSVADVVHRSGLDQRSLRFLAEAGAFDCFFPEETNPHRRRRALWTMLEELRGTAGPLAPVRPVPAPPLPAMSPLELTESDYRMTGITFNGHPMRHLREMLRPNGVRSARDLLRARDGERVAMAGLVICRQRPGTAKGFVFLTLEDETGTLNVVVTPKRFERQALLISTSPLLLVRGTLQVEESVVNLRGEQFRSLRASAGEEWAKRHDFH